MNVLQLEIEVKQQRGTATVTIAAPEPVASVVIEVTSDGPIYFYSNRLSNPLPLTAVHS